MQELSFLYSAHCHDLFYIPVKYHGNILKNIKVTEQTQIYQKGTNGEITVNKSYYS